MGTHPCMVGICLPLSPLLPTVLCKLVVSFFAYRPGSPDMSTASVILGSITPPRPSCLQQPSFIYLTFLWVSSLVRADLSGSPASVSGLWLADCCRGNQVTRFSSSSRPDWVSSYDEVAETKSRKRADLIVQMLFKPGALMSQVPVFHRPKQVPGTSQSLGVKKWTPFPDWRSYKMALQRQKMRGHFCNLSQAETRLTCLSLMAKMQGLTCGRIISKRLFN